MQSDILHRPVGVVLVAHSVEGYPAGEAGAESTVDSQLWPLRRDGAIGIENPDVARAQLSAEVLPLLQVERDDPEGQVQVGVDQEAGAAPHPERPLW